MRKILLIFYICTLFADDNIKIHDLYNLQEELKKESPVARQCAPWRSKYKYNNINIIQSCSTYIHTHLGVIF